MLFLLLVGSVRAQSAMPGTFTTPPIQTSAVVIGPILTPPLVSFGSGLTPPVVVNGQAMVVSAPMSNLISPSAVQQSTYAGYVNGSSGYVSMPTPLEVPVRNPVPTASESTKGTPARHKTAYFEYVVAPSVSSFGIEETGTGVGDTNLGQMADNLRKGPPPTQRNFTNDDIARLNGVTNDNYQMPGAITEQPVYPRQQQSRPKQPQPQPHCSVSSAPLPHGAEPSPLSPNPPAQRTPSQAANATASERTPVAQNTTRLGPGSDVAQGGNEASRTSGQQNTPESSSSAQASTERQLPATSSFLPLVVLCGLGITALGILFSSRH